jgi:hypothetical protein
MTAAEISKTHIRARDQAARGDFSSMVSVIGRALSGLGYLGHIAVMGVFRPNPGPSA